MERIDKIISSQTQYTRKEIKELIRKKRVTLNGDFVYKSDIKINPEIDIIEIDNERINIKKYVYLILNKPKGYVSATIDKINKTVLDLVPKEYKHRNLFPAGRLDKDTTGLMLITDDGDYAHNILSPKKHIKKDYLVQIDIPLKEEMIKGFKEGIKLQEEICKPANLEIIDKYNAKVTLTEGKYHQIKRMFAYYGATVVKLERISMGNLKLPSDLNPGECRELTSQELSKIIKRD